MAEKIIVRLSSSEDDLMNDDPRQNKPKSASPPRKAIGKKRGDDASKDWTSLAFKMATKPDLPPLNTTEDFSIELMEKLILEGFHKVTDRLNGRPLRVGTACSGTEAPILFLNILSEGNISRKSVFFTIDFPNLGLKKRGLNLEIEHVFSIEIEPWKQTYIRRNFPGVVILRDITEIFTWIDNPEQKGFM